MQAPRLVASAGLRQLPHQPSRKPGGRAEWDRRYSEELPAAVVDLVAPSLAAAPNTAAPAAPATTTLAVSTGALAFAALAVAASRRSVISATASNNPA